jgi:hypothetical protein
MLHISSFILRFLIESRKTCAVNEKKNGKVVPVTIQALYHEDVRGNGPIDPHFVDLDTSRR